MTTDLATLRRRALYELALPLRRTPRGYVCDRICPGHLVARTPDEQRAVLTRWLEGRPS